jgi:hypothetical protein
MDSKKEFPWFKEKNQESDMSTKHKEAWYESAYASLTDCCHEMMDTAKEKYPVVRAKAEYWAREGWNFSERKSRQLYGYCKDNFPHYWEKSKFYATESWHKIKNRWLTK